MRVKCGLTVTFKIASKSINPKPGAPAVLEPLTVTGAVTSGNVAVTMGKRVPVRLCNFSTSKAAVSKGACLGLLVEAYLEEPTCVPEKCVEHDVEKEPETVTPLKIGRVTTLSDVPDYLKELVGATSEVLTEQQYQHFLQLLLNYHTLFAKSDSDLGYMSAITHKIDTGMAKPVRQPVRRTPLGFQGEEEIFKHGIFMPCLKQV